MEIQQTFWRTWAMSNPVDPISPSVIQLHGIRDLTWTLTTAYNQNMKFIWLRFHYETIIWRGKLSMSFAYFGSRINNRTLGGSYSQYFPYRNSPKPARLLVQSPCSKTPKGAIIYHKTTEYDEPCRELDSASHDFRPQFHAPSSNWKVSAPDGKLSLCASSHTSDNLLFRG
jgi:hypothetical protein